ncbi:MAG: penicillin-binding protein 2 [Chitinophagaceae bacterium]
MLVNNQNRSRIIQIIFVAIFLIILVQLLHLQIFSSSYKLQAENNAIYRKVVYPDRGIIYDRTKKAILENNIMYDLVVTPGEIKNTDTLTLCNILGIDTTEFKKRIINAIIKNTSYKPSVFEPLLNDELFARLNENMYKFPGFVLNERPIRSYPYNAAANVLGYLAEVDSNFLKKHKTEGYEMGDYAGMTGLERSYEKVLMGQRGVQRYIRDNRSRIQGKYENGAFDTAAVAGKNLYLSLDVELQQLGEKLMNNKVGSIVAIDPRTGGVLCMISSPTYNPNLLTGSQRSKHFSELYTDPRLPLINRAVNAMYSPGSTFKTMVGIVALTEGDIDDKMTVYCPGAYYGCGRRMGCHAPGTFNVRGAIAHSCNSYFAVSYRRIIDNPKFPSHDSALNNFNKYAYSFGLGNKLGVDIPSEQKGNIPVPKYYDKIFGPRWVSCNIISNAIGQGEVQTTLAQLANVMAIIANKGWYYTPHLVDSIEGGDEYGLLNNYKIKHRTLDVPDAVYEIVHDGMQGTMEFGTGAAAEVPGVVVCGKTGTVENSYHGIKQKDHAFFGAFAPRNNPKIAIAVMCENAGFGAESAAPIASLMIEKYLKDSIPEQDRKDLIETIAKKNLIPERMQHAMDSLYVLDSLQSIKKQKEKKDTINAKKFQSTQNAKPNINFKDSIKNKFNDSIKHKPAKDSQKTQRSFPQAVLTTEKKKFTKKIIQQLV